MTPSPARHRSASPPAIELQVATRAARLPRGSDLPGWVAAAGAAGRGAVTVRLVGWPEGRRLNERFRGRSGATNVLAFPAAAGTAAGGGAELGDLVICLPLVHREAREQGKAPLAHLAHLVVHGTLHLLGHDHDQPAAARKMENQEAKILRRLGFDDPYRVPGESPRPAARHKKRA